MSRVRLCASWARTRENQQLRKRSLRSGCGGRRFKSFQNPREEPGALAAHAGICAEGEEKSSSLPRPSAKPPLDHIGGCWGRLAAVSRQASQGERRRISPTSRPHTHQGNHRAVSVIASLTSAGADGLPYSTFFSRLNGSRVTIRTRPSNRLPRADRSAGCRCHQGAVGPRPSRPPADRTTARY